jgi:uncharacterized membrane protein SpoIIM required for sporulation
VLAWAGIAGGTTGTEAAHVQEREFIASGRQSWERLAAAVEETRKRGVRRVGAPALRAMHDEYRRAAADLAYAQTHFPGSTTQAYLNRLVGQAHAELYGAAPHRLATAWRFLARDYPRLLRREWRSIAVAGGLMVGAAIAGWIAVHTDATFGKLLLPEAFRDVSPGGLGATQRANAAAADLYPLMGAQIGVNNVQVAIMAFAGGITFGVLTVYAMLQNGVMIGVLGALFTGAGVGLPFWALIAPHGSLELPAIVIAGGAGLKMGAALLFPGDLPRGAALKAAAPVAARLLLGTVPLFALAAAIEGFFTPTAVSPVLKLVAGAVIFALLVAYVTVPGRGADQDAEA